MRLGSSPFPPPSWDHTTETSAKDGPHKEFHCKLKQTSREDKNKHANFRGRYTNLNATDHVGMNGDEVGKYVLSMSLSQADRDAECARCACLFPLTHAVGPI